MRPAGLELAEIFRQVGPDYRRDHAGSLSRAQLRVMSAIERCRTAALGGHVEQCDACGHQRIAFNSCRDRHCPKCQSLTRAQWLEDRRAELLPVEYFHVVFTVPQPIEAIAYQNKALLYDMLFKATAQTLRTIAADPKHLGAEIGFIAVLHTWGQNLLHHPHLHCVVPGGGVSLDGKRWIACRPGFFLPVRVLSRLFRRLFLELSARGVRAQGAEVLQRHGAAAGRCRPSSSSWRRRQAPSGWSTPRRRSAGPSRCWSTWAATRTGWRSPTAGWWTSATAASRSAGRTTGTTSKPKVMRLPAAEFTRRFLLHVLPSGLQRIRHYGLLANRTRDAKLERCRELLGVAPPAPHRARPRRGLPRTSREKLEQCTEKIRNMIENHPEVNKEVIHVRFDKFND